MTAPSNSTSVNLRCLILFSTLALVTGCGSEEGPTYAIVKGSVTLNGEPVKAGNIMFVPTGETKGPISNGSISVDGTYEMVGPAGKGVVVGTHKVLMSCPEQGSGPDSGLDPQAGAEPCIIPPRYSQERVSDLTATVAEGENDIPFALTGGGKKK